jgi:hypothetical protein
VPVPILAMRGRLAAGIVPRMTGSWRVGSRSLKAGYSRKTGFPSYMKYRLEDCGFVGTFWLEHVLEETDQKNLSLVLQDNPKVAR